MLGCSERGLTNIAGRGQRGPMTNALPIYLLSARYWRSLRFSVR